MPDDATAQNVTCRPWELWLVRAHDDDATRTQLLVADCTRDIHGEPPALVEQSAEHVSYTSEPSGDLDTLELALHPPSLVRETHRSGTYEASWNWPTFRGQACAEGTCVPALPDVRVDGAGGAPFWKTTALGACSMLVDGATPTGGTARGVATGAPTAALRLVLVGDTLVVEISDDVFVTRGVAADALDIWFSSEMTGSRTLHRRVRMDGTGVDQTGHVITVDMTAGPGVRRFALPDARRLLDAEWEAAYDDVDDGRSSRGTLSTGKGDLAPPIFTSPVPCAARGGALAPVVRTPNDAFAPVAP